ncbi:unnamed protein product [Callosobruchus maculatus]|uniref:Odorant receptor n=1 Tax=Callosobruchus maculatus TaxID=64391 RepID=A0A653D5Z8_CALMS|nr:unnamed protein product [Callosobruchus maculatus]
MPYYPDIEWSIQVCSILGSSPATNFTKMQVFRFLLTNCLLIGFPFLTFWNFVDKKGATLPEVVEVMSNFTTFFHALGKTTVMFFNRRKIKKLFDITKEEFWPLPDYERTIKSSRMGRNFYFGLSFSFSACAVAKLYIYGESKAGVYRPQWFPQQVFFVMIDIMYIYMTLGFNACDVTIRTILILLTTQFKMLNEELLTMFDSKNDTKVSRKVFKKRFKRCLLERGLRSIRQSILSNDLCIHAVNVCELIHNYGAQKYSTDFGESSSHWDSSLCCWLLLLQPWAETQQRG